jgi:hypothetical protein
MPTSVRAARALPLLLLLAGLPACSDGGTAPGGPGGRPDGEPPVACGARLGRAPGSRVLFVGRVHNAGAEPRLEWSADGSTLLIDAAGYDPCAGGAPTTVPSLFAVPTADGAARPVLAIGGERTPTVPTQGGRAVLLHTAVERVGAFDVYGLLRVSFAGTVDTLLRGLPRPRASGVDTAGRIVAAVVPGAAGVAPDTLVTIDVATRARRVVAVLDAAGAAFGGLAPDGSRAIAGGRVIRLVDGATLGRVPALTGVVATRWRPEGVDLLVLGVVGDTYETQAHVYDVVAVPEGTRRRIARTRGVGYELGAFHWLPDGVLYAWERRVDEERWRPPATPPDTPFVHAAIRRFAPGDTIGREVLRGVFNYVPYQVRVAPDRRRLAFATGDFVAVAGVE